MKKEKQIKGAAYIWKTQTNNAFEVIICQLESLKVMLYVKLMWQNYSGT